MEELKGRIASLEAEVAEARSQRDKSTMVARKFEEFVENPSNIVNKAK